MAKIEFILTCASCGKKQQPDTTDIQLTDETWFNGVKHRIILTCASCGKKTTHDTNYEAWNEIYQQKQLDIK